MQEDIRRLRSSSTPSSFAIVAKRLQNREQAPDLVAALKRNKTVATLTVSFCGFSLPKDIAAPLSNGIQATLSLSKLILNDAFGFSCVTRFMAGAALNPSLRTLVIHSMEGLRKEELLQFLCQNRYVRRLKMARVLIADGDGNATGILSKTMSWKS